MALALARGLRKKRGDRHRIQEVVSQLETWVSTRNGMHLVPEVVGVDTKTPMAPEIFARPALLAR